jgi:[NiFe] hydrogenase diaphorase moiety large subunit
VPRTKIEGVAGFYSFFYTAPRGKYRVLFSDNITDRMLGSKALMDRLCNNLWVERGKVSEDGLVSVDDGVHRHVRSGAGHAGQ